MIKAFYPFDILLPKKKYDYSKWAVIACDQYTSDASYWDAIAERIGSEPSTFRMIVPEAYLNEANVSDRITAANKSMEEFIKTEVFDEYKSSMVYVEREQTNGKLRKGIVGTIDLNDYDFQNGVESLVRPTEDVVISRIPPRLKVRENALLETSHVLLLIADKNDSVIGGLKKEELTELYNFNLQPDGGQIRGYLVSDTDSIQEKLAALVKDNIMFLVGDGNHSIATAKEYYEKNKASNRDGNNDSNLARYAMVEVINLYDESLIFEPIHRIMYNVEPEKLLAALKEFYPGTVVSSVGGSAMSGSVVGDSAEGHKIEFCFSEGSSTVTIPYKYNPLAVGALQQFLDQYGKGEIDYIHDAKDVRSWSAQAGNAGFILPKIDIDGLLEYIKTKGRLPRKTFSIGNQEDKKYYLECRRIK